jgi:hypothetical protein
LEQPALYNRIDFMAGINAPQNAPWVTLVLPVFLCPTDPASVHPIFSLDPAVAGCNPAQALGLWYAASMGPTHDGDWPDSSFACTFCYTHTASPTCYCCQGYNFGTGYPNSGAAMAQGQFTGMFGRWPKGIRFADVTDGLSRTIMVGETLGAHCRLRSVYAPNFPVAATHIPLNTMDSDEDLPAGQSNFWLTCGFKSLHPNGANFALGDASVHFVNQTIDYKLFNNLGTRAGGENVELP